MANLLVVFGATGQQGASVIHAVLKDPELSQQYSVRGITRDATKPSAQALARQGVELVEADADKPDTLPLALKDAHTVFIVTTSVYEIHGKEREISQGKAIASTAVAAGAKYLIFSSTVETQKLYNHQVDSFEAKSEIEDFIRSLPVQSAFFDPGMFMQNFQTVMSPQPTGEEGVYAVSNIVAPDSKIPLVEISADTGKYVGAILADPERYSGKVFCAATKLYSFQEMVDIISRSSGKKVVYNQLPAEVFASFMSEVQAKVLIAMMRFIEDVGYFGSQTKAEVEWTAQQARGELTTFEEFLVQNPMSL